MRAVHAVLPALVAALLVAGTSAAAADPLPPEPPHPGPSTVRAASGSCSLVVPEHIALSGPRTTVTARLGADCPAGAWAAWDLVAPDGSTVRRLAFSRERSASVTFAAATGLGAYRLRPVAATDADYEQLAQNRPTATVGARSRTAITSARDGSAVTVRARATVSTPATGRSAPRARARVILQRSACDRGCAWTDAASATTDAHGVARFRVESPSAAHWRTHVAGTRTAWGSISVPFTR